MKNKSIIWKNKVWITGIVLIILSTTLFLYPHFLPMQKEFAGLIVGNYGIAIIYLVVLVSSGITKSKEDDLLKNPFECLALFLVLALISAFSLNREVIVFHESTFWLQCLLTGMCAVFIGLSFISQKDNLYSFILFIFLGVAMVLNCYFAIYLLPYYPVGLLGTPLMGISLHIFVPLWFILFIFFYIRRQAKNNILSLKLFFAGMFVPVAFTIVFLLRWNSVQEKIKYTYNDAQTDYDNALPGWIKVSQLLAPDWITERVVKSKLIYVTQNNSCSFFRTPNLASFNEIKEHDPLVMLASLCFNHDYIEDQDKIKVLKSMYGSRHIAQNRLWSGNLLRTENCITDVMIYPQLRIAYTEKIIDIRHTENTGWIGNQQEAIYTFQLPEGAVASALSLWINGIEEKAILAAKAKADSAYKTIVGVESRDPSLVHWQEGNTITIRVFPCTPKEKRKFKIGFTSPLKLDGSKLLYQNIKMEGPAATEASETVLLRFFSEPIDLSLPQGFEVKDQNKYKRNGAFEENWHIAMKATTIPNNNFFFNGNSYSIQPFSQKFEVFSADNIYLDLNSSWTLSEYEEVLKIGKDKKIFSVLNQTAELITDSNREEIYTRFHNLNFSLFPFFAIAAQNALVITKNRESSPNLDDLEKSDFQKKLYDYFSSGNQVRVFQLNAKPAPYIASLKELRALICMQGNLKELAALINKKIFIAEQENEKTVQLAGAGIKIVRGPIAQIPNAPDHLMRLFAYNDILRKIHLHYFTGSFINEELVTEAQEANIVTPVSSLVVLESVKDYKRFGIENKEGGLNNAAMKSAGAVPEPHEWCIIILSLLAFIYAVFAKSNFKKNADFTI